VGLRFASQQKPGQAHLRLYYRGKLLRHEGVGLFNEHDGDDDYIFTDFEPFDARRAFPCFDEPAYKVPVRFILDVPEQHLATTNAAIEYEHKLGTQLSRQLGAKPGVELKRVVFRRTAPLPTYLWALAVGPFGVVDAGKGGSRHVPLRILTLRGREEQGRYAASVTAPIISLFERYTGVPYPYDKLDQVAVPNQSHAMENPGLITYGQRSILIGKEDDTAAARRRFAKVCAHELAHHWTGDLVTLNYWDETWLNESFASFLGSKITEQFKPEWDERLDRLMRREDAMSADSLVSARRIRQPITTSDDIVNAFDPITYAKGQSVLTMIESWVGPSVFQRGLHRYLAVLW
jgi:alanyl aminopeptidase